MLSLNKLLQYFPNTPRPFILIGAAVLLPVLVFALMRLVVVPFLHQVDNDFVYSANLVSIDNFFNEETSMFSGDTRSVTLFAYAATEKRDGTIVVKNSFDVRTVTGEKIISIGRDYSIDSRTWKHDPNQDNKKREGYLFAPRHNGKQRAFSYWHVNYDRELNLVFEKEENINGLVVHRYGTSFGVDQTNDLTHLPGVPEDRGINLDVSLSLWVEPVSGWLIKYEDNAIAYYYDQQTRKRIAPWNKFSNAYTRDSVNVQIEKARDLRMNILTFEIFVPLLLFITLVTLAAFRFRKWFGWVALFVGVTVSFVFTWYLFVSPSSEKDPVVIGMTRWVQQGNTSYDRNIQGFKDAFAQARYTEGEDIIFLEEFADGKEERQREIVRSFLEQDVDIIYSLTTPGTLIVKELVPSRPVVFSVVTYPEEVGIIESLTNSGNNIVGTRNWVATSEQLEVYREIVPTVQSIGFLRRTDELNSGIQLEEMREAARPFDIEIVEIAGSNLFELLQTLENKRDAIDTLFSACDTLIQGEAEKHIIDFAHRHKIPSFSCNVSGPENGDLVGTVADFYELGQLAGEKAVLILEGATPSSLKTSTVARPFIYVNKNTADMLGITIPQRILAEAVKVIR